jgi:hypothetical protein
MRGLTADENTLMHHVRSQEEPGGTRSEEPVGAKGSQEKPRWASRGLDELGGATESQEGPGGAGARRSQEEPRGAKRSQEKPLGDRRGQEEPRGTSKGQEEPRGVKRSQEESEGARGRQEPLLAPHGSPSSPWLLSAARGWLPLAPCSSPLLLLVPLTPK